MIRPRPAVAGTAPAAHGGPLGSRDEAWPVRLDFSASLNAWGPAPAVLEAVRAAPVDCYPDPEYLAPRRAAAARWGVGSAEVGFGAGAAEWIQAVSFAYLRPGDRVLVPVPTFGEYERAARLCGARVVPHPAHPPAWRLDAAALAAAIRRERPRMAWLCAPNNPTGQAFGAGELRAVADACAEAGALLVLDQSYDAFLERPLGTPALPGHPAVLHLRSITKDHALAGVRAAFAVGPPAVVSAVERARVPWSASTAAQAAAVAALSGAGEAHLARTLPRLRAEAARVAAGAAALGLAPVPTATHFVLLDAHRVGGAAALAERLRREHAIAVRDCTSFGLPGHVRVAARTPADNDELLAALGAACSS